MENEKSSFDILIQNRESVGLNGVLKLDSFNHEEFLINTELGYVHIKGNNLSLGFVDMEKGTLTINGTIESVGYIGKNKTETKESFLKKLFK